MFRLGAGFLFPLDQRTAEPDPLSAVLTVAEEADEDGVGGACMASLGCRRMR
jgi:hypothetical protein